jgi:hypothetical protein
MRVRRTRMHQGPPVNASSPGGVHVTCEPEEHAAGGRESRTGTVIASHRVPRGLGMWVGAAGGRLDQRIWSIASPGGSVAAQECRSGRSDVGWATGPCVPVGDEQTRHKH